MHHALGSNRECRAAVTVGMRIAIVTLCLAVHACDTGTGGAVELSWKLRPASSASQDPFVACQGNVADGWGPIARIRLNWTRGDDGTCPSERCFESWDCDANHAATGFDLPVGKANLWLTPECDDGQPAAGDTYTAPAIVQRDVIRGQTVSLGAVELVVSVTGCMTATTANRGERRCICRTPR